MIRFNLVLDELKKPVAIDKLDLPVHLSGPLSRPRVHIDPSALTDALVAAGYQGVVDELGGRLTEEVDKLKEKLGVGPGDEGLDQALDEEVDKARKKVDKEINRGLRKLLGGDDDD